MMLLLLEWHLLIPWVGRGWKMLLLLQRRIWLRLHQIRWGKGVGILHQGRKLLLLLLR